MANQHHGIHVKRELETLRFGSISEYACGVMLEKYVPGFELKMGHTLQVDIGQGRTCDFRVNGVFVEFHPIVLMREFRDSKAFRDFWQCAQKLKRPIREVMVSAIQSEMREQYFHRRKLLIDAKFGCETLVVAINVNEVRDFMRWHSVTLPSAKAFRNEFDGLCKQLKEEVKGK
jgi:hypothetical protein